MLQSYKKMVLIEYDDRIGFYDHNGRHYNVIITFIKGVFRFSVPSGWEEWEEWEVGEEIPASVIYQLRREGEFEALKQFIEKCKDRFNDGQLTYEYS